MLGGAATTELTFSATAVDGAGGGRGGGAAAGACLGRARALEQVGGDARVAGGLGRWCGGLGGRRGLGGGFGRCLLAGGLGPLEEMLRDLGHQVTSLPSS